jgi:hypothetical protein
MRLIRDESLTTPLLPTCITETTEINIPSATFHNKRSLGVLSKADDARIKSANVLSELRSFDSVLVIEARVVIILHDAK